MSAVADQPTQIRGMVAARYPLHELEALLGWPIQAELAEECGVTWVAVQGWIRRGLSWAQADELATRFGYHPIEVWGADWFEQYVPPDHPRAQPPKREQPAYGAIGSYAEKSVRGMRRKRERTLCPV